MKKGFIVLVIIFTIPSFFRMLRPGIYSMQDPHIFRLFEFDRCVKDLQLPCRWAPDSGFGYGEPLFNFYTQIPYLASEAFHLIGFQLIDSIKIIFILSLVGSAVGMFFLSQKIWGNKYSALVSSVLYVYAPYRAVDVWVRAALPEALAFILFPLVAYFAYDFVRAQKRRSLVWFSATLSLLLLVHNLSLLMFGLFLIIWLGYKIIQLKRYRAVLPLFGAGVLALLFAAFYLLPVVYESKYVNLGSTISGYFDFRAHFATINELLISRFWGYGASLWGPKDDLSLSVGQVQWSLPLISLVLMLITKKKEVKSAYAVKEVAIFTFIGWLALFLTHNKSTFVWEHLPFLAYLQFPWRWLSIATFSFALAGGAVVLAFIRFQQIVVLLVVISVIAFNITFFREDIWYTITDKEQFGGQKWNEQIASSLGDYWPNFSKNLPNKPVPQDPGEIRKTSKSAFYRVNLPNPRTVQFPIAYFPGWRVYFDGKEYSVFASGNLGLITVNLPQVENQIVQLRFFNTPIRTIGNVLSLLSLMTVGVLLFKQRHAI